ncbi:MAG: 1,4-alpha-glucan branching protein GlgB [Bacteroidetes bacterium]|nr:1,4-alpha-glucan branching protein GlgB [Bacteroidota bacterium]MBU1421636.1 1,4-alpha-glucan branching protein GlgB [Bacteroidota bacterium]MBU2471086.1 1,4-alpha-glucan branching protein GlgB [Bacteroidota bacterium]
MKKRKNTKFKKHEQTLLTELDIYLFKQGNHAKIYEKLGAHHVIVNGVEGTHFAVWAPNAKKVSVVGDFNGWNNDANLMNVRWDDSGIWETFIPGLASGTLYKYRIVSNDNNYQVTKGDPHANYWEISPKTASVVWDLYYEWGDLEWMNNRHKKNSLNGPYSIYEVHFGSWRRVPEEGNRSLTYREMAPLLADYVKDMGFTHVEFLPLMEHPFYGSWGYQCLGYFAPTSRYGTPQDFMYLIDYLHQNGIGVILDWVPSHFPSGEYGLSYFDGTYLYEHQDPKKGYHPDWNSYIFNYNRNEVRTFLLSSAMFWLEMYHVDGLRVDAVASMLYLDYSRKEGEWIPNVFGGRENLEAISFLKKLNESIYKEFPDVQTFAEESTAWPMVSRPNYVGGLGFGMKWNMGWMNDTLDYFSKDPIFRKYNHNNLTFSIWYAFFENFVLSISHDDVVHGKGSLVGKMPGNEWQRYANVRLLFGYMYGHPGKKLLFMGNEIGQRKEWNHEESLEWHVLQYPFHGGLQKWLKDLNHFYRNEPVLYERDFDNSSFEWIDFHDWENSIMSFIRRGSSNDDIILIVCNLTPVPRHNYRVGVPRGGFWTEVLNSDSWIYAGSGQGNFGGVEAAPVAVQGRYNSISITLPPLSVMFFKNVGK